MPGSGTPRAAARATGTAEAAHTSTPKSRHHTKPVVGSTPAQRIQDEYGDAELVTYDAYSKCVEDLQTGNVDAVTTDDAILAGLAAQDPWLRVVGPSLGEEFYGVGIPKGQDDMIRFVNGVLERIRVTGRWQEIRDRWLSILDSGYGAPQPYYRD